MEYGAKTPSNPHAGTPLIQPGYSNDVAGFTPIKHKKKNEVQMGNMGDKSSFISQGINIQPGHQRIKKVYDNIMNKIYKGIKSADSPLNAYVVSQLDQDGNRQPMFEYD